jgi:signal transduction histidine kinase
VCIEVHDTGIGIPPHHLSKVFDAFHRVDSMDPNGLGLGLFVVRRAVDVLGHRIEVRVTVGRGVAFRSWQGGLPAGGLGAPAIRRRKTALNLCSRS